MKLRVLVERDGVMGVGAAEDVATVSAMVATLEEVEGSLADGRVADDGIGVGFPVGARREACDFSHRLFWHRLFLNVLHRYGLALAVAC